MSTDKKNTKCAEVIIQHEPSDINESKITRVMNFSPQADSPEPYERDSSEEDLVARDVISPY